LAAVVDKDDFKDVVFGRADNPDELAYGLLFHLVRCLLGQGLSVLCDSPLRFGSLYTLARQVADETGSHLAVLVLAGEAEHRP
jgi:hypothetical protein